MFKDVFGVRYELSPFQDEWVLTEMVDKHKTSVSIPASLDGIPVTTIKHRAFAGCKNLKRVEIGNNLNKIGELAFLGCCYLEHVYASSAHQNDSVQVGFRAFENCRSLISFKSKVSLIEENAFRNCVNLEECNISAECKEICNYAFCDCVSLEKVFIESNPISPIYIQEDAFFCTRIFELHCQRNIEFKSKNYIHSKAVEEFISEPTVIYCPSWSNLTEFSYLGRKVVIEEKCS